MTDHSTQYSTVTVPVALGGKSNPYVPDPAPTLLVELASVDRAKEEAKIAALLREADATAASVLAAAQAASATLLAEAEEAIASLTEAARTDAEAITAAAEDEARSVRMAAEESVAVTLTEFETRRAEVDATATALDALQSELEQREGDLADRLAAVDAEAAETAALLAAAHRDADSILTDAREAAEAILETARRDAEDDARALIAEARVAAENDPAVEERIAEIESVHRIEVQVLHDREIELLERIAALEARVSTPPPAAETHEDSPVEPASKESSRVLRSDAEDSVAIDLDGGNADVTVGTDSRMNGRHTSERSTDRSTPGPIVTHAPLTEQLSTSAFRVVPENDRRGRRRR